MKASLPLVAPQEFYDAVRMALVSVLEGNLLAYLSLFVHSRSVAATALGLSSEQLKLLRQAGLVIDVGLGDVRSDWAIHPIGDILVVTDASTMRSPDQVFPVSHESLCLVSGMELPEGGDGLDIGTGSGLLALFSAKKLRKVVVTDINHRAIALATFNAKLNSMSHKILPVMSDLFPPAAGERFDYVSCNPPFIPVPPGVSTYLHSDGGLAGDTVVKRLFDEALRILSPEGLLQVIAVLLGDSRETWLHKHREQHRWLARANITVSYLDAPCPVEDWLSEMRKNLRWSVTEQTWRGWVGDLAATGLTHAHYVLVTVRTSSKARVEIVQATKLSAEAAKLLGWLRGADARIAIRERSFVYSSSTSMKDQESRS